jgi:hypothetical protein
MAYLTSELIADAYYTSSIVSREFETPTGGQMSDGLRLLNDVIADRTIDSGTIPYTTTLAFSAIAGQSQYFLANWIDIETFVFFINGIRFQTINQQRDEFFGSTRAININSLPFNWNFERGFGGGTLSLYFIPDVNYPLEIRGEQRLTSVTEFQDLSLTIDEFYRNFMLYLLTDRLCQYNSFKVPNDVARQLEKYFQWIKNKSNVMDLRQQKLSSLNGTGSINYAVINLSGGWQPIR